MSGDSYSAPKNKTVGSVAPGTAAALSTLVGAQYNTALPSPTNGQQVALQVDSTSRLITRLLTSSDVVSAVQSGTWTVQPGNTANTTPWLVTDSADGPVTPGTVATKSTLIGGQYNSSLPTLTTGQQVAIQTDVNGRILTNSSSAVSDQSGFTYGVTTQVTTGGVYQDTSPTLTAGQQGAVRLTQNRGFHTNLRTSGGVEITSDSPGTTSNQRIHVAVPDTTTASTALGALNASITIATVGLSSIGFQLAAGTLIGTLVVECSLDGGSTYPGIGSFYDPSNSTVVTSFVFGSSNTAKTVSILPIGGSSNVRVRVSAYTSGTANGILRASMVTGAAGAVTAAAFGTVTNSFPSLAGNTATLILAANANRKYAYISNNSGSTLNIQFGSNTGIGANTGLIIASKSFYELKGDNLFTGNIYGFSAGAITISVTEGTP